MTEKKPSPDKDKSEKNADAQAEKAMDGDAPETERGGFEHRLEPTRYGDWDVNGRCSDF